MCSKINFFYVRLRFLRTVYIPQRTVYIPSIRNDNVAIPVEMCFDRDAISYVGYAIRNVKIDDLFSDGEKSFLKNSRSFKNIRGELFSRFGSLWSSNTRTGQPRQSRGPFGSIGSSNARTGQPRQSRGRTRRPMRRLPSLGPPRLPPLYTPPTRRPTFPFPRRPRTVGDLYFTVLENKRQKRKINSDGNSRWEMPIRYRIDGLFESNVSLFTVDHIAVRLRKSGT